MDTLSFEVDRGTGWCNVGADKRYSSRGDLVDETRQSQARHTQDNKRMDGAERGWRLAGQGQCTRRLLIQVFRSEDKGVILIQGVSCQHAGSSTQSNQESDKSQCTKEDERKNKERKVLERTRREKLQVIPKSDAAALVPAYKMNGRNESHLEQDYGQKEI